MDRLAVHRIGQALALHCAVEWEIGQNGSSRRIDGGFDPWKSRVSDQQDSHSQDNARGEGDLGESERSARGESDGDVAQGFTQEAERQTEGSVSVSWWKKKLKNPLVVVSLFLLLWICFFYQYGLLSIYQSKKRIEALRIEYMHYDSLVRRDSLRLNQLQTDNANLERFAREQYYMHRDNEDVFVVE